MCGAENIGTVMVERMGQCRLSELLGYAQEALVFGGVSIPRNGVTLNYRNPTHKLVSLLKLAALEDITKICTVKPLITDPPKSGQPLYNGRLTCHRLILP